MPFDYSSARYALDAPLRRILVPIKGIESTRLLLDWLAQQANLENADLRILHVVKPLWCQNIPHTSAQALISLRQQDILITERQKELCALARTVQLHFPEIYVSYKVVVAIDPANAVVETANEANIDCIVLCCKSDKIRERLFGNRLTQRIMRLSNRKVFLMQIPRPKNVQFEETSKARLAEKILGRLLPIGQN